VIVFTTTGTSIEMNDFNTVKICWLQTRVVPFRRISNSGVTYYVTYSCAVGWIGE
jgi:hypothetical protein